MPWVFSACPSDRCSSGSPGCCAQQLAVQRDGLLGRALAHQDARERHAVARWPGSAAIRISICSRACLCRCRAIRRKHVVVAGRAVAGVLRARLSSSGRRVLREFVPVRDLREHAQSPRCRPACAAGSARIRSSASRRLPSASMLRAVTTSAARVASFATCCAAISDSARAPDHLVERCEHAPARRQGGIQLDGARNARIASGACRRKTWQWPRSWNSRG